MDPLSALRTMAAPEWRALPNPAPLGEKTMPGAIPASELEKLTPSFLSQPSSGIQSSSFDGLLNGLVQEVAAKQAGAKETVSGLLAGKNISLHQTMIAMEEASVAFQLMVEVRNKLLESYHELMRMQV